MRIAIDIRALQLETQYRGVGTYVRELILKFLARQRQLVLLAWPGMKIGLENQFLNACQLLELPKPSSWPWAEFNGYQRDGQDKDLFFKKLAQHVDLIHFPCAQDLRYGFPWHDVGAPRLITVDDLLGCSNPELAWSEEILPRRLLFKGAYRKMIQHYLECNGILTNSQFTEHMVRASLKNNLPTIRTVLLGISDRYVLPYVSQVDEYRLQRKLPPRFILHVGGLTGAKNVEALLQATAPRCSWPFVMAGPYTEEERGALAAKYPQQQIFWLGYVDREELPMLYAAASLFAFPSLMEGFGLPVLEAMAVGTPVVCSNVASLPEVAGNAAYTVDPRNLSQLSQALYTVMNDENLRMQMRTRGLERAQHLSWRRTADTTWMVYESFVEEYQRRRRRRT